MKLYSFFRSGTSQRLRIALNLKGLQTEYLPVDLRTEQHLQAAGLLVGHTAPRDPFASRRPVDVFDAKADAEAVLAALGAPARVQVTRKVAAWWHPWSTAIRS